MEIPPPGAAMGVFYSQPGSRQADPESRARKEAGCQITIWAQQPEEANACC